MRHHYNLKLAMLKDYSNARIIMTQINKRSIFCHLNFRIRLIQNSSQFCSSHFQLKDQDLATDFSDPSLLKTDESTVTQRRTLRKQSSSSTLCSTPPQRDLKAIIHSEEKRYKRKGYGLIFATIIAVSFFYFSPILAKEYWPRVLNWIETNGIHNNF